MFEIFKKIICLNYEMIIPRSYFDKFKIMEVCNIKIKTSFHAKNYLKYKYGLGREVSKKKWV